MEDILASIRRILNEDEPGTPAAAADQPLTLTEDMLVAVPAAEAMPAAPAMAVEAEPVALPAPEPEAGFHSVPEAGPVSEPEPPPPPLAPPAEVLPAGALLAPAVAAAASASIGTLMRAVSQDRGAGVTRGGPSIEDVVREELRPLLKDWLDQHLPGLVERLVRAEIERVVGRGLG
ncbi:DUF2497 domain-containing protein [Paeniroseomonas aquatica]